MTFVAKLNPVTGHCGINRTRFLAIVKLVQAKTGSLIKSKHETLESNAKLLEDHQIEMKQKEKIRENVECVIMARMLEDKLLMEEEVMRDPCLTKTEQRSMRVIEKAHTTRCASPSLLACSDLEKLLAYHTSVFLCRPDDLLAASSDDGLFDERFEKFVKYHHPLLQLMPEMQTIDDLYDLAEEIVYETSEGCKGQVGQ